MFTVSYKPAIVCFLVLQFSGCAHPPVQPFPTLVGLYIPPLVMQEETALLEGSIRRILVTRTRARIESVDLREVPIARSQAEQPTVILRAGPRSLTVVCETDMGTGSTRAQLSFRAEPGHNYVLRCEEESVLWNKGTNFWIEDRGAGDRIVAKASGWAPSYRPSGRVF